MATPEIAARLQAVGNICTQWAYLEYLFANVIWWLLKIDKETGIIITGGLDIRPRAGMAINLARHLKADRRLIEALTKARDEIGSLSDRRNRAVHGVSFSREGDETVMVEVHRGKGSRKAEPLATNELFAIGSEISVVATGLIAVLKSLEINVE